MYEEDSYEAFGVNRTLRKWEPDSPDEVNNSLPSDRARVIAKMRKHKSAIMPLSLSVSIGIDVDRVTKALSTLERDELVELTRHGWRLI